MRTFLRILIFLLLASPALAQVNVQTITAAGPTVSLQTKNNLATLFNVTLTGNVTAASMDSGFKGQQANFNICQNSVGGFTWAWPATFQGTSSVTIATGASACTQAQFINVDGTAWQLTGGGGGGGTSPNISTVYAWDPKYNLPPPAKWVCDATFVINTTTVTTPATDRPFLSTDSFAIVVGGNAPCGGNPATTITTLTPPNATATFVGAHTITLSGNATANCTPTASQGGCALFWGADHTTAVQTAFNDAANNCGTLILPSGGLIINALVVNTTSLCPVTDSADDKASAVTVMGQGPFSTMLLFTPNVSFTSGMFTWGSGAFKMRTYMHDFGVASFTSATGAMAGQKGFDLFFNSEFYNIWFMDFFPSAGVSFTALNCAGVLNAITNCHNLTMINAGFTSAIAGTDTNFYSNWVQGATNLFGAGGNRAKSWGNRITLSGTQGAAGIGGGFGEWDSTDDVFNGTGTTLAAVGIQGSAGTIAKFHNPQISGAQTSGPALIINASNTAIIDGEAATISSTQGTAPGITNAGTLVLRNTTVNTTGSTGAALSNTGTVIFKEGNSFVTGSITNTGVIQVIPGQGGYTGACTGVVTSATTVGLYGLGQQTTTTCVTAVVGSGQVMAKPGTIYALYCTATAGNQAGSACTVVKNGAAQTMTCSLNAVASCTDGTAAHWVSYVAGDILAVSATAGVGDTLANVKGTIVAQ